MPANMFKTYIFEPSCDLYEMFFSDICRPGFGFHWIDRQIQIQIQRRSREVEDWKIPPIRDVVVLEDGVFFFCMQWLDL